MKLRHPTQMTPEQIVAVTHSLRARVEARERALAAAERHLEDAREQLAEFEAHYVQAWAEIKDKS